MLKDGKKKGEFLINNVLEEENEILDCDSAIDGEEIDDLHLMTRCLRKCSRSLKKMRKLR
eukprot:11380003-Ditylum_brightwellii.AAC.1